MSIDRRDFMKFTAMSALALSMDAKEIVGDDGKPVENMARQGKPITREEYLQRQETARRYMREAGIDVIFLTGGSSLFYFTGIQWGISERLFAMILPMKGEPAYVTPAFEKGRALEQIQFGNDVRAWEEDESPYNLVAAILKDRGIAAGTLGLEETVDYRFSDA